MNSETIEKGEDYGASKRPVNVSAYLIVVSTYFARIFWAESKNTVAVQTDPK